jgi:hypothetical protein
MTCSTEFYNDHLSKKALKGQDISARGNAPGINKFDGFVKFN